MDNESTEREKLEADIIRTERFIEFQTLKENEAFREYILRKTQAKDAKRDLSALKRRLKKLA